MTSAILKVLIVVTSHGQLGDTGKPTGYYLPEVAHPHAALVAKGLTVEFASPKGGAAPLDPSSVKDGDKVSQDFWKSGGEEALQNTLALADVDPKNYAAILFAGGHGTMWDFRGNPDIERISRDIYERGGVVSAVCHGPAALVSIRLSSGKQLIAGKRVTGFSNAEEDAVNLTGVVPFALETEMRKAGANFSKADLWKSHVVVDGRLITGQNPASAHEVGVALATALTK